MTYATFLPLFRVGAMEIIIIVLLLFLLFGAKKIPELMRGMGRGVKEFKDAVNKDYSDRKEDESEGEEFIAADPEMEPTRTAPKKGPAKKQSPAKPATGRSDAAKAKKPASKTTGSAKPAAKKQAGTVAANKASGKPAAKKPAAKTAKKQ